MTTMAIASVLTRIQASRSRLEVRNSPPTLGLIMDGGQKAVFSTHLTCDELSEGTLTLCENSGLLAHLSVEGMSWRDGVSALSVP